MNHFVNLRHQKLRSGQMHQHVLMLNYYILTVDTQHLNLMKLLEKRRPSVAQLDHRILRHSPGFLLDLIRHQRHRRPKVHG